MKTGKEGTHFAMVHYFAFHKTLSVFSIGTSFLFFPETFCIKSVKSVVLTEILVPPSQYCCLHNSVGISRAAHLVSPRPGHGGYWIQRKVAGWAVVRLVRCRHRRSVSKQAQTEFHPRWILYLSSEGQSVVILAILHSYSTAPFHFPNTNNSLMNHSFMRQNVLQMTRSRDTDRRTQKCMFSIFSL